MAAFSPLSRVCCQVKAMYHFGIYCILLIRLHDCKMIAVKRAHLYRALRVDMLLWHSFSASVHCCWCKFPFDVYGKWALNGHFELCTNSSSDWRMQSVQDDLQLQVVPIAILVIFFTTCVYRIFFILSEDSLAYNYLHLAAPPPLHWLLNHECYTNLEHIVWSLSNTCLVGVCS